MRALLAFLLLCVPMSASAQGRQCGPYDAFVKHLADNFNEAPVSVGVASSGMAVLQVFASPEGKTFSALAVSSNGTACLLFTGTDWEPGEVVVSAEES